MSWRRFWGGDDLDLEAIGEIVDQRVALAARLDDDLTLRLLELAAELIADKRWEAVDGLDLTDEQRVTIAANASIPILALGPELYRHVRSIIVHPTTATSSGLRGGPADGVVDDEPVGIIGEAAANRGPVLVSWDAARYQSRHPAAGHNVVIHEFAHKIDMADGYSDGTPPMAGRQLSEWSDMLAHEYADPGSRPSDDVLDPYAWESPAEFFAVATEVFFCTPRPLRAEKPELYDAMREFYRLDPAAW